MIAKSNITYDSENAAMTVATPLSEISVDFFY